MSESIAILVIPFLIGASIHYMDAWVSVPMVFLLAVLWVGAWVTLK